MTQRKQDVTIAAGSSPDGDDGVNPLKLLAGLSTGNAEKTKTGAIGLVSTGYSVVVRTCCRLRKVLSILFILLAFLLFCPCHHLVPAGQ